MYAQPAVKEPLTAAGSHGQWFRDRGPFDAGQAHGQSRKPIDRGYRLSLLPGLSTGLDVPSHG